jgi:hypothetical protein
MHAKGGSQGSASQLEAAVAVFAEARVVVEISPTVPWVEISPTVQ